MIYKHNLRFIRMFGLPVYGQVNHKGGTVGAALHLNAPAVCLNDFLGSGKPQARASGFGGKVCVKYLRQIGWGYPLAGIRYADPGPLLWRCLLSGLLTAYLAGKAYLQSAALRHGLQSVEQQVEDRLGDPVRVKFAGRDLSELQFYVNSLLLRVRIHQEHGMLQQFLKPGGYQSQV